MQDLFEICLVFVLGVFMGLIISGQGLARLGGQ